MPAESDKLAALDATFADLRRAMDDLEASTRWLHEPEELERPERRPTLTLVHGGDSDA